MDRTTPLMIDLIRGNLVESRHACRAVIAHSSGRLLDTWGAINAEVYPRSALKPLQALPLVESGAAEAHGPPDQGVALACASHTGEDFHRDIVRKWLTWMGLSNDDPECGTQEPRDEDAARDVIRRGDTIDRVFNNCSGKHSAFLPTALHLGEPTAVYTDAAHPVQRRLANVLSALGGTDLTTTARGRVAAKTDAEGAHIGIVPECRIGIAVKVEDGASRASGVGLCALLDHLDLLDDQAREGLAPFMDVSLMNLIGDPTGRLGPAYDWRN